MADDTEVFSVELDARFASFEKAMTQAANRTDSNLNRIEKKMAHTNARMRRGLEFRGFSASSDKAFRDVERRLRGLQGLALGGLATMGVTFGAGELLKSLKEDEEAARRLEAVLKTTGQAAGLSQREIAAWAEDLEKRTGRGAAEIQTVAAQLATFTSIGRAEFLKAIEVADDLAATFGGDLQSNLDAVARALDDPIKGFGNLQKRGFALADSELKRVKAHLAAGESAKAQGIILENLSKQVSGAAEATNQGLTKALNDLKKQADDTFKVFADQHGTEVAVAALEATGAAVQWVGENVDTLMNTGKAFAVFMTSQWVGGMIASEQSLLRKALAAQKAKGSIEALTLAMRANPATVAALAISALTFAILQLNKRYSEGEVMARRLADQSKRTASAFAEYEKAARAAADATGEAKKSADALAATKRELFYIELRNAQALAETTIQMAAQRAEMAKLAAQQALNRAPKSEAEAIGQLAFAGGSENEAARAQRQAEEANDEYVARLQDLLDLQERIRTGFADNSNGIEFEGKTDKNAGKKAETRRRAVEDMRAEIEMQEAVLRNDLDRVRALEREQAVRQRTRSLIDAEITTNKAAAAAEAERIQQRLDAALLEQMEREGHEARKALDLELYRLEANHEQVRTLERQAEQQERVTFWQQKGYDLVSATSMATLDLVELENARATAAQRSLSMARQEHEVQVATLSGNERLAKQMRDQAEIRDRTERYRTEGRLSPEEAGDRARGEVERERLAERHGEARELFATAFSDGIRAALTGDLQGFLSNQFGSFADTMFQRAGEQLYDQIFGTVDAVADGATQGAAVSAAAAPGLIAAGTATGGAIAVAAAPGLVAAATAAGQAYAVAASATKALTLGFSRGGYTGPGGVHQPAGVVHRGEVVFSQADVRRHGGPGSVDAMRRGLPGYARGGVVARPDVTAQASRASRAVQQAAATPSSAGSPVTFDLRGAVVTQDLLDQMNQIGAMAEAGAVSTVAEASAAQQRRSIYRTRRGS